MENDGAYHLVTLWQVFSRGADTPPYHHMGTHSLVFSQNLMQKLKRIFSHKDLNYTYLLQHHNIMIVIFKLTHGQKSGGGGVFTVFLPSRCRTKEVYDKAKSFILFTYRYLVILKQKPRRTRQKISKNLFYIPARELILNFNLSSFTVFWTIPESKENTYIARMWFEIHHQISQIICNSEYSKVMQLYFIIVM